MASKPRMTRAPARAASPRSRNGVTAPAGFLAAGIAAGIKKSGDDLALVFSESPCAAAGVFTRNLVAAAPVAVSRDHLALSRGRARVVVLNAGCANAGTGARGLRDARATARLAAQLVGCEPCEVLVCSTGPIGYALPMPRVREGLRTAFATLAPTGGARAARAIMTTDTRAKESVARVRLPGGTVAIGGMAKGAGMIHPDMATLLAVVTTDAIVAPRDLRSLLRAAADLTFNRVTIDGDTSTNDTLLILANGCSGVRAVRGTPGFSRFAAGVTQVCRDLAEQVVRDGEGATLIARVTVTRAPNARAALAVARTIATSALVKTALAGREANWGRVLAAAGRAGVAFAPERASVSFGGLPVYVRGSRRSFTRAAAKRAFRIDPLPIIVDLAAGAASASILTCDLTKEYVAINGSYIS